MLKILLSLVLVIFVTGCSLVDHKDQSAKSDLPNIMIWVADDQYLASVGCYGGNPIQTPNIDSFAKEGLRFTRAYSTSSICTPARSALYTGMYPIRNGSHPNHSGLKKDIPSMPGIMKNLGYRCALVGKEGVHQRPSRPTNTFVWDALFPHKGTPIQGATWGEKVAKKHRDMDYEGVKKFIFDNGNPFCLFVASSLPHSPGLSKIDNGMEGYPANNWTTDLQFWRFLKMLDEAGKKENTIVIYVSDNGSNTSKSKYTLYEPGVNVPMIIRWPGHVKANTVSLQLVDFTDIMPTIMEIAGESAEKNMDGKSLIPILDGKDAPIREDLFLSFTCLGVNEIYDPFPIRSVVTERYKLIHNLNYTIEHPKGENFVKSAIEFELYDLQIDPKESHNLAGEIKYKSIQEDMISRLNSWQTKVGDKGMETELEALEIFPELKGKVQLNK